MIKKTWRFLKKVIGDIPRFYQCIKWHKAAGMTLKEYWNARYMHICRGEYSCADISLRGPSISYETKEDAKYPISDDKLWQYIKERKDIFKNYNKITIDCSKAQLEWWNQELTTGGGLSRLLLFREEHLELAIHSLQVFTRVKFVPCSTTKKIE